MGLSLQTPVENISKVGSSTMSRLNKLGILTIEDLIFYFPFRYEDFTQVSEIGNLDKAEAVTVKGKLELITNRRSWKKKIMLTEGLITDGKDSVKAVWFNQPYLSKNLKPGDELFLSGKFDGTNLVNPIYEKTRENTETIHTARLVPIYSLTEGLTQKQIRWLISIALQSVNQLDDYLPLNVQEKLNLDSLSEALQKIHFPKDQDEIAISLRRLKFNELFLFLLQTQSIRQDFNSFQAQSIKFDEKSTKKFVDSLPFELTNDQRKSSWQILQDLEKPKPMNRLLQGDVGSGKTVVAAIAALNLSLSGNQVVFMAPTEILAYQHFKTLTKFLADTPVRVALLTRSYQKLGTRDFSKAQIRGSIQAGNIDIVVGTHALIQESIKFDHLALAIIDEQHRFGVEQRKLLHDKGKGDLVPHFLSMTATPIPRSLALTVYGDLDVSVIRELPKERKKIITEIISPKQRQRCYDFIYKEVKKGRQVFVICPLIDPSDKLGVKSVTEEYKKLNEDIFPDLKISLLHGRLKSLEKEAVMDDFLNKKTEILVATSVIEVGVDVPNATVMMIEESQRFGLAQLHQFRGRVGRGPEQSYCYLLTSHSSQKTKARLDAMVTAKDGFELAQKDLEFRGPGEMFGVSQSGWPEFQVASFFDSELISVAKLEAEKLMEADPSLDNHPLLKEKVDELNKKVHWE